MEAILNGLKLENLPIDVLMVIIVLLSGIFQTKYMQDLKLPGAWKTLLASLFFSTIYILIKIFSGADIQQDLLNWFFSYLFATSFYELLFKSLVKKYLPEEKVNNESNSLPTYNPPPPPAR